MHGVAGSLPPLLISIEDELAIAAAGALDEGGGGAKECASIVLSRLRCSIGESKSRHLRKSRFLFFPTRTHVYDSGRYAMNDENDDEMQACDCCCLVSCAVAYIDDLADPI